MRYRSNAAAMSALTCQAAVPAGQYAEHSCPRMVRQAKLAPARSSFLGALLGHAQRGRPPAQGVGSGPGVGVRQHWEHESLGVPEGVPVVPGAREPLARDGALLGSGAGLQHVEEAEADRLLRVRVTLHLDVGAVPEVVQIGHAGSRAGPAIRCTWLR